MPRSSMSAEDRMFITTSETAWIGRCEVWNAVHADA